MTRLSHPILFKTAALLVMAGLAAGCSLQSRPTEEVSQARAAVAQAVSVAAPDAQSAQVKLALAQRWVDAKDYGPARWLAEQAEVDAELALAKAAGQDARRVLAQLEQARTGFLRTSLTQPSILAEKSK